MMAVASLRGAVERQKSESQVMGAEWILLLLD